LRQNVIPRLGDKPSEADIVDMRFYKNNYFGFGMAIPGDWHVDIGEEMLHWKTTTH